MNNIVTVNLIGGKIYFFAALTNIYCLMSELNTENTGQINIVSLKCHWFTYIRIHTDSFKSFIGEYVL